MGILETHFEYDTEFFYEGNEEKKCDPLKEQYKNQVNHNDIENIVGSMLESGQFLKEMILPVQSENLFNIWIK